MTQYKLIDSSQENFDKLTAMGADIIPGYVCACVFWPDNTVTVMWPGVKGTQPKNWYMAEKRRMLKEYFQHLCPHDHIGNVTELHHCSDVCAANDHIFCGPRVTCQECKSCGKRAPRFNVA